MRCSRRRLRDPTHWGLMLGAPTPVTYYAIWNITLSCDRFCRSSGTRYPSNFTNFVEDFFPYFFFGNFVVPRYSQVPLAQCPVTVTVSARDVNSHGCTTTKAYERSWELHQRALPVTRRRWSCQGAKAVLTYAPGPSVPQGTGISQLHHQEPVFQAWAILFGRPTRIIALMFIILMTTIFYATLIPYRHRWTMPLVHLQDLRITACLCYLG